MGVAGYPSPLRERLGDAGVSELSRVLSVQKDEIVTVVEGRFERRVMDSAATLRGEMQALATELRGEMNALRVGLRSEMDALRVEMRGDMKELRADFKAEIGTLKADLIKWSFLFWIGQVAAIMAFMTAFR